MDSGQTPIVDENGNPQVRATYNRAMAALKRSQGVAGDEAHELMEQSLRDFIWLWEESLNHRHAFVGVRSSFMLDEFKSLADSHPPAQAYLEQQVEQLAQCIRDSQATHQAVRDLDALNQVRKRQSDTAASLHTLVANQPELAEVEVPKAWRTLIHSRDWVLFTRFPPEFEEVLTMLRELRANTPGDFITLAQNHPELLDMVMSQSGLPSFEAIVLAYQASNMEAEAQHLREHEASLRTF